MSKKEKLIQKLKAQSKSFSYEDAKVLLEYVNYPDLWLMPYRSELAKAQADQPKCCGHYVVSVITPMDDTLVHSSVQAL